MSEPLVLNLNNISIAIKCLPFKFAKKMVEEGNIHFSCAESWSNITNKGKGDKYEGTFANIDINNFKLIKQWKKIYGDNLNIIPNKNFLCLKNKNSCLLPTYCFYTLKHKSLNIQKLEVGIQKAKGEISESLFRDFADGMTKEQINELPEEERPAIVIISRPDIFKCKIIEELKKIGIDKKQIITRHVDYNIDFNNEFLIPYESPDELFYKDKYFSYQDETRIVINSEKLKFKKYDEGFDINVGDMRSYVFSAIIKYIVMLLSFRQIFYLTLSLCEHDFLTRKQPISRLVMP